MVKFTRCCINNNYYNGVSYSFFFIGMYTMRRGEVFNVGTFLTKKSQRYPLVD